MIEKLIGKIYPEWNSPFKNSATSQDFCTRIYYGVVIFYFVFGQHVNVPYYI
jgi:hypothetical protein